MAKKKGGEEWRGEEREVGNEKINEGEKEGK